MYYNSILQALFQAAQHLNEKREWIRIREAQKHADPADRHQIRIHNTAVKPYRHFLSPAGVRWRTCPEREGWNCRVNAHLANFPESDRKKLSGSLFLRVGKMRALVESQYLSRCKVGSRKNTPAIFFQTEKMNR